MLTEGQTTFQIFSVHITLQKRILIGYGLTICSFLNSLCTLGSVGAFSFFPSLVTLGQGRQELDGWHYGNCTVLGRVSPERKHYEPYEVPEEAEVSKNAK